MARGDGLFRQWELIKVLQAHRFGVSTDDIAARLECNKRTVQRDLGVLQDIFPISYEQRGRAKRFWKLAGNTVEFKRWVLGFGRYARIISPKALADEMRDELKQAFGNYSRG